MSIMQWTATLELGVDQMDATHREFVRHVNLLAEAADEEMLARFDDFYAHTVAHFEQEMQWMRSTGFPPIHCHAAEHEGVLEVMREVRGHLEQARFEVGRVLATEMAAWLRDHAATMDAMLAGYLRVRGPQAQAAAAE